MKARLFVWHQISIFILVIFNQHYLILLFLCWIFILLHSLHPFLHIRCISLMLFCALNINDMMNYFILVKMSPFLVWLLWYEACHDPSRVPPWQMAHVVQGWYPLQRNWWLTKIFKLISIILQHYRGHIFLILFRPSYSMAIKLPVKCE